MRARVLLQAVATVGGLAAAREAAAQDLPDPVFASQDTLRRAGNVDPLTVEPRDEWQTQGLRLGNYMLAASADLAPLVDSNARVRPDGDAAVAAYVAPTVRLSSIGEHDPLIAFVAGSLTAFPDRKTETVGTLTAGVDWTKELNPATTLNAQLEGGRYIEDRVISFTPDIGYRPTKYDRIVGTVAVTSELGRLVLTPSLRVDRAAFHDNRLAIDPDQVFVQRTRSLVRIEPALVAGYAVTNVTALYVGANVNSRDYDVRPGFNSHGYAVYGGVRLRPTPLIRLDVALGYQRQYYRPQYTDPKGLYAHVGALYSPDRQTAIQLEYRRDISETGGVEVGGAKRDFFTGSVRRRILRDFTLTASAELRHYDFASIDRRDSRAFAKLDALYIASRRFNVFARAEQAISRTSGTQGTLFDFERTRVLAGVTVKL